MAASSSLAPPGLGPEALRRVQQQRDQQRGVTTGQIDGPGELATTKANGLGPQTVNRNIDVGPNSTNAITDMLWPPPATTYNAVVKCTVTYNGTQTSIGEASQAVTG